METSLLRCPLCREPVTLTTSLFLEAPLSSIERQRVRLHRACGSRLLVALARSFAELTDPSFPELLDPFMVPGDQLSARQTEVMTLACRGWTNDEIGQSLGLSGKTVKNYLSMAYQKLGASNRIQAMVIALSMGLAPLPIAPPL